MHHPLLTQLKLLPSVYRDNTPHVKNPEPDWPVVFSSLKNVSHTIRHNFPNTSKYPFSTAIFCFKKCLLRPIRPTYVNYICLALIPVLGNHDVFPGDLYPSEAESFYRAYLTWDNLPPKCVVASQPALHNNSYQIRCFRKQLSTPLFFISTGKEAGTSCYPNPPRIRSVNVDFIQWTWNQNWRYWNNFIVLIMEIMMHF